MNLPPGTRVRVGAALVVTLMMAWSGCSGDPDGPVQLSYSFEPGRQYSYRFTSQWVGSIALPDSPPRPFTRQQESTIQRIIEAFDPVLSLATVREVRDSRAVESREDSRRRRSWNREYVMTVGTDGRIVAVTGPGREHGFQGERYTHRVLTHSQPVFPEHAISPGFNWIQKRTVPLPAGGTATSRATFTFLEVSRIAGRLCAIIETTNHLFIPFQDEREQGVDESRGSGQIIVDVEGGFVVREEILREVHPTRWIREDGRVLLVPGRTIYEATESLVLVEEAIAPARLSGNLSE